MLRDHALAVFNLRDLFNRYRDFLNQVLHAVVFRRFLKVILHLILVTGIGVNDIPLSGLRTCVFLGHDASPIALRLY
ncbi:hypothetical protein SDC9_78793 [bioreactor metagenome]|uniref:Uncharacterized protein n=1 Tax=bioreactor metagenome TaxID=1076179 RepID=A0A644YWK0_9ZZZZ